MCGFFLPGIVVRSLQRNRASSIYKEIYYEELVHVIVEAERSHDLLSAN